MKNHRPLVLVFALLALIISACSQPQDMQTPALEAQFGGAGYDTADAVSVAKNGVVTIGNNLTSLPDSKNHVYQDVQLRQLDASGRLLRQVSVSKVRCTETGLECVLQEFLDIRNDSQGNVYALTTAAVDSQDVPIHALTIYKYNSTLQKLLWKKEIKYVDPASRSSLGLDSNGNVYVAFTPRTSTDGGYYRQGVPQFIRYSTNGVKWYQRNSRVGKINDLAVSSTGDIYVVGDKGLSRYNNGGGLIWTKAVPGSAVAATATHSYVLNNQLYSVNMRGNSERWDIVSASTTPIGVETDTLGNVYVRGYERFSPDDIQETPLGYIEKFSASGKSIWSTTLPFAYSFRLNDIATYDGSNVYAVGSTDGTVNGVNRGSLDAFVIRLNAPGQQIWER